MSADMVFDDDLFDDLPDDVEDQREQTKYDCHCPDCDREFPGGDRAGCNGDAPLGQAWCGR